MFGRTVRIDDFQQNDESDEKGRDLIGNEKFG